MINENLKTIAAHLKRQREGFGWSLDKLAYYVRVTRGHMRRLENGKARPSWKTLERWCYILGCDLLVGVAKDGVLL